MRSPHARQEKLANAQTMIQKRPDPGVTITNAPIPIGSIMKSTLAVFIAFELARGL